MISVPSNENLFDAMGLSFPNFEELYHGTIDNSLLVLGRAITLHLTPQQVEASGLNIGPTVLHPSRYNPILGSAPRNVPNIVSTSRDRAVHITPRDVQYRAHIVVGPRDLVDKDVIGRLENNEVATTTVIESLAHIQEAESVTIDGRRYALAKGPRPIGLQTLRYIITVWQRIPEKENG